MPSSNPTTVTTSILRSLTEEFDHQVDVLVELGYPEISGLPESAFRAELAPLRSRLDEVNGPASTTRPDDYIPNDYVPFVVAVHPSSAAAELTGPLMRLGGHSAVHVFEPGELAKFVPIPTVKLPDGLAYLLTDLDVGSEFCDVRPADALPVIEGRERTPLTVNEGIALVTLRPDMLRKNRCFSLLGSRCGDKRVSALWISDKRPKLGWCWNGNPHTWLGSASARSRVAIPAD